MTQTIYPTTTEWEIKGADLAAPFEGFFTHPNLIAMLDRLRASDLTFRVVEEIEDGETVKRIEGTDLHDEVEIGGTEYVRGKGGNHSKDRPMIYEADERFTLLDADFGSYYPSLIVNHGLAPEHLDAETFIREFDGLRIMRLAAKQSDPTLADALKIPLNSLFGLTGMAYGWLTCPPALVRCTIWGQLTLFTFINLMQQDGVEVISCNTDGLTMRVRRERVAHVKAQFDELAALFKLTVDWTEYQRIARRDVNNYVAVTTDGKVKAKGAYKCDPTELGKKPANKIAVDAARQFLVDGTPVRDTVMACTDIRAFIDYFKCQKGWHLEDQNGTPLGGIGRWYRSTTAGTRVEAVKEVDGKRIKKVEGAVLVPDLPDHLPDDLDFDAYVQIADGLVKMITEPETRERTTIPLADLTKAQRATLSANQTVTEPDLDRVAQIDLTWVHDEWNRCSKGNRYDTAKSLLARLWTLGNGSLTKGDLRWLAAQIDAEGYFGGSNKRTLSRMIDWICRTVSPYRLPRTLEEHVERAIAWTAEHVAPAKAKRKMLHTDPLHSTFISGDALRKYGKNGDVSQLALSICAAHQKHLGRPDPAFIIGLIEEINANFSQDLENHPSETV